MLLTISTTSYRRVFPLFVVFVVIFQLMSVFYIDYPINLIVLFFDLFFLIYFFGIKRFGLYYRLEDLYYENDLFFVSKLNKRFTTAEIECIQEYKKIDVAKIKLNDGTVYYVIFSSEENKALLTKDL